MEHFYHHLKHNIIDMDLLKQHRQRINLDVVEYLYKSQKYEYIKTVIPLIQTDLVHIHAFLLGQENFGVPSSQRTMAISALSL